MKPIMRVGFLLALLVAPALAAGPVPVRVTVPLASPSVAEQRIDGSLRLRVQNYGEAIDVEVLSSRRVSGCFANLAHRWPHGPDPSEIMAWQIAEHHFKEPRVIRVCGQSFTLKVELIAPETSIDGTRFLSGSVIVTVMPSRQSSPVTRRHGA